MSAPADRCFRFGLAETLGGGTTDIERILTELAGIRTDMAADEALHESHLDQVHIN